MDFFGTKKKKKRKGASPTLRVRIVRKQKNKCKKCGVSFGKIEEVIHHKDGDRSNKDESNLEALCPNCHGQKDRRVQSQKRRKKSSDSYADSLGDLNDKFGL